MLYYQMGRYLLIASSREDNPLAFEFAGLSGATDSTCRGSADYKSNINYQMNYWPSETANLGGTAHAGHPSRRQPGDTWPTKPRRPTTTRRAGPWPTRPMPGDGLRPGAGMPWGPFFERRRMDAMQDVYGSTMPFRATRDFPADLLPGPARSCRVLSQHARANRRDWLPDHPHPPCHQKTSFITDSGAESAR